MIIGIGGISNSGKSALAALLRKESDPKAVKIICQDNFTIPIKNINKINHHVDWENPQSIDFDKFKAAVLKSSQNYEIVIAEGFMVFYKKNVDSLFDRRIFIELSKEEYMRRKQKDLRWGKEPDWYIQHIWDSFEKYGNPPANQDNILIINGEQPIDIANIMAYLNRDNG